MSSNLTGSPTSAGAHRRVCCDGQSYLTSHTPLLLDRVPVRCAGVIELPPDLECCRTDITRHGEATEMDRYQWFSGARNMGGWTEGGCRDDRLQAGTYPGGSVKGEG